MQFKSADRCFFCLFVFLIIISGSDKPECVHYMTLADETRRYSSYANGNSKCDDKLGEGWYRFGNERRMSTTYGYSNGYCDTQYRGWLRRGHPSVEDGRVTRQVCFYYSSSCHFSYYIKVRNCGSFYVYKLKPVESCNARYCTD